MGRSRTWIVALLLAGLPALEAGAAGGRERAIEEIPELMGRILESQEEIRRQEDELAPIVEQYDARLQDSKSRVDAAESDGEAVEALVDYVEAYAARLETQQQGLAAIEGPVVRMRADARQLARAAQQAKRDGPPPEVRERFYADQFQGVAQGIGELATLLGREDEAETAGAVLHAGWASHSALDIAVPELGPEGAVAFARKIEGLYARHQARTHQLAAERASVRRLLDLLIERQLGRRLDALFAGGGADVLGDVLSGEGKSQDWSDLNRVVARALDIPAAAGGLAQGSPSLERLDYFARGAHRGAD